MASLRLGTHISGMIGNNVKIIPMQLNDDINQILKKINKEKPDILGLSAYMWTVDKVKEIADKLSNKNHKLMIIVGGPETISLNTKDWPKNCVFVVGEGENTLFELCLLKMREPNITADDSEIIKITTSYKHCPFPTLDYNYPLFSENTLSILENKKYPSTFTWYESARGCPFNCGYCGHKTRPNVALFDIKTVRKEIINMKKLGIKSVYIIDPIVGGTKDRGKELLKLFQKYAQEIRITAFHRPEFLDEEYISILKKSNLEELQIGIQSLNPNVPKWVRSNSLDYIEKYLPQLTPNKIPWQVDLIIGLPGDDMKGLNKSMNFVINELNPRIIRAYQLTVIKNTAIYSILDKTNNDYWVKMNEKNRVTESNSYNPDELNEMLLKGTAITTLYNYLSQSNWMGKEKKLRNFGYLSKLAENSIEKMSKKELEFFRNQKESECQTIWSGLLKV